MFDSFGFWGIEFLLVLLCALLGLLHIHRVYGYRSMRMASGLLTASVRYICFTMYVLSEATATKHFSSFSEKLDEFKKLQPSPSFEPFDLPDTSVFYTFADVITYSGPRLVKVETYLVPSGFYPNVHLVFKSKLPETWVKVGRVSLFSKWLRVFLPLLFFVNCCYFFCWLFY